MKVLGFSGSLRAGSYNSRLLESARRVLPADAELEIYEGLREIPPYDEDFDDHDAPHPAVKHLRDAIAGADALFFVTPEYNGSIPGVLKNAIDWASRPAGESVLSGKPVAAISSGTGQYGGVWAQADLRRVLGITRARVIDAEFAVPHVHKVIDEHGDALRAEDELALTEIVGLLVEEARINAALAAQRAEDEKVAA